MAYQIQVRSDTAANWTGRNPVLAQGEAGYEVNTGKLKYGDGATPWNSLAYFGSSTPPAGNNTQIQFNNSGAFGASANLTFSSANSSLFVTGNVQAARFIGSGNALTLSGITSNVIPAAANTYTLGSPTHQWKSLYVAGNTIYLNNVPLSLGSNNSLSFNGAPVVTTSTNPNATTQISGSINIGGAVVANTLVGNGSRITGISYANIVGAYGNSNVANYMPVYGGVVAASTVKLSTLSAVSGVITVATASSINLGANSKVFISGGTNGQVLTTNGSGNLSWTSVGSSNAAVQAFLSSGNVTTISTSGAITSNTSVTANTVTTSSLTANTVSAVSYVAGVSLLAPVITATTSIVANTITANSITGPISSDSLTGNTLSIGNIAGTGNTYMTVNSGGITMGQVGGQTISMTGSGTQIVSTGGVTIQGAATSDVTIGGGTTGDVVIASPVTLGSVSNISISGGSAGQVLTTDGSSNLSWTTIASPYGNSNVADYLSSGTVSTDIITSATVTANSISLSNVSSISYQTASTASLANAVIYSTAFNDGVRQLTSVDFSVVASDGTDRQVSRLLAVGAGAAVVFTQYASLSTAATLGNFTVDLSGGNVNLNVEPLASPLTYLVTATATYE